MAKNNDNRNQESNLDSRKDNSSVGNQQQTTQTGAQNNRGENIEQEEDQYSEDLRKSGDRLSSNHRNNS
ncbi:hypothetical protein HRH25_08960 [Flavisolibacter sp. BT320]|nr:hypothetical protein [Flavisolibacter longurius]